ncbi:MAG: LSM domain-containing protein [Candidatus Woesearchaeota archaeon]
MIYRYEVTGDFIMETSRPLDALNAARNKRVIVELKNGKQLIGTLKAFDIHINVSLDDAEERENGEVKRKIGSTFIRGDTIILITIA